MKTANKKQKIKNKKTKTRNKNKIVSLVMIFLLFQIFSVFGKECATKTYSSDSQYAGIYFFDKKEKMIWDISADYGIPFSTINLSSRMKCIVFLSETLCGITNRNLSENGISIRISERETITLGNESTVKTTSYEVTRLGNTTRVYLSNNGDIVAFSLYTDMTEWINWTGWIKYIACDIDGALNLNSSGSQIEDFNENKN